MKLNQNLGRVGRIGLLLAVCISALSATNWSQSVPTSSTELKRDRPVTRSMAGKDRHIYTVRLRKGVIAAEVETKIAKLSAE